MSRHSAFTLWIGLLAGLGVGVACASLFASAHAGATATPQLVVRLHKVSIRPDQLAGYGQWQTFLHARHADALRTLEREHMFIEAMFRSEYDPHTLYWLEVRDDQGAPVESSNRRRMT